MPAERQIAQLMPETSPVRARQFVHVSTGLMLALVEDPRAGALLDEWRQAAAAADIVSGNNEQVGANFARRIAAEGRAFVVERLNLPWPWLGYRLFEAFWQSLYTGQDVQPLAYMPDLFAPPIALHFRTKPGESVDEALARLRSLTCQAAEALERPRVEWRSRERMKATDDALMWAGCWWYWTRVLKPRRTIASIAATLPKEIGDPRRTIQLAIARAQRLLVQVPATFYPPAGE
jgi:hypothetical protein